MSDWSGLYNEHEAAAIAEIYDRDKRGDLGGALASLPTCFVDRTATTGQNVKVWHYARVLAGVTLGDDVMIGAGTEIGRGSTIGDGTRIQANCFLPSNTQVGRNVFIGPGVTMTDDRYPRVHARGGTPYTPEPPVIEDEASIGAGVVLCPGVRIGYAARIAAGAVVTRDVPRFGFVRGVPGREGETPESWTFDGPMPDFP